MAFLNSSFTTTLATAGTALLSMSFVFATTAQEVLGSCIFLFVKHPFDVGDRVDIGDEQLTVEHISLLFTVFKRLKNHKTTQVPNILLNANWIDNISRSKAMREQILMYINFDTTLEDIQLLKNEMQAFVLDKDNSRDFQPDIDVEVTGIAEMNKMELRVEIRHKSNWANEAVRAARRSKFMCALVLALRKIPIYGPGAGDAALGDVSKPTYSVAVTDAAAAANRDVFAAKKEAKRLVPSKKPDEPKTEDDNGKSTGSNPFENNKGTLRGRTDTRTTAATISETAAIETLNTRPPAVDPARDDWAHCRDDSNSSNSTLGDRTSSEARRGNDIEEVRGLLKRAREEDGNLYRLRRLCRALRPLWNQLRGRMRRMSSTMVTLDRVLSQSKRRGIRETSISRGRRSIRLLWERSRCGKQDRCSLGTQLGLRSSSSRLHRRIGLELGKRSGFDDIRI